jgi:nicotinamidase/pyrazinamidase
MKIDKETDALLIVDIQNDFCPGGALAVSSGDEVVSVVNRISALFWHVAATQDWHPEGHVSFASAHSGKRSFDSVIVKGETQALWPDHCVQGELGANFHPGLDQRPIGMILRKGRDSSLDSYSAFFENDTKTKTAMY